MDLRLLYQIPGKPATLPGHHQDEYADALRQLAGAGVALADVQSVQKRLMERKRYVDMTGNWLNHPNDYLARIHAQVLS